MEIIIVFIGFIYLIISNKSLSVRLRIVELKLKENKGKVDGKLEGLNTNTVQPTGFIASLKEDQLVATPSLDVQTSSQDQLSERFTNWLKEDWLMKLGAFLFIVGFGWFVSYAFANNWVGPIGRISIGIVAGIIIMALGFWRMTKYPSQGAVFMALGAGMAMLTIFAGRALYGFFTPISAVVFDFIIVAFVSFASYKFNTKSLAFTAQILAFVAPLLTAGSTEPIFLFSYLFFISLATLFFASVTGWRELIASSLVFVGLYSLPHLDGGKDAPIILNFIYLFGVMYLLAGMSAVIRKGIQNINTEIFLATLNGLLLFVWILNVAPKDWQSMLFAVWAVIFVVCSFGAFKFSSQLAPFYSYGAVAVMFIGAATAVQLSGATLVIAFTLEVLLLILCVLYLTNNVKAANTISWLFTVPMVMSLSSISLYSSSHELFSKDFFVLVLISISLIISGRILVSFSKIQNQNKEEQEVKVGSFLIVFGIFYLGYIVWQFVHILMIGAPDLATMTTLIIYTIFGIIAYFWGLYGNDMARTTYGTVLLVFVVVRLIFIDVWQMELFGRVITFLAIGVLLMGTAFLTKRKKQEVHSSQTFIK